MKTTLPPTEPELLGKLYRVLERISPVLPPIMVAMAVLSIVITVFFSYTAFLHLPWGITVLDMSNTGNVGQFFGGTVGTMFSIISSLLLVMTLWVQINEYKLTRHELQQTVLAQQTMAQAQNEQLGPLKEQALIGRQVMEMDLLTKALQEVREDMKRFTARGVSDIGVNLVILNASKTFNEDSEVWKWLRNRLMDEYLNAHLGNVARAMLNFSILLERAELIYNDLTQRDLPASAQRIRRKEVVLLVNNECRDLVFALHQLRQRIVLIQNDSSPLIPAFKEHMFRRIDKCTERMLRFSKIDLEQDE